MYKPKKSLGQNFLIESGIAKDMVDALDLKKGDEVVEIGAGLGALTEVLVKEAKKKKARIRAVEIDERFAKELKDKFSKHKNVKIHKADILRWLPRYKDKKKFKVVGSLPYYITSPILHGIVRHKKDITLAVLLIQKEVAEKISGKAPKASYLSTYLQTFYRVKILKQVPKSFFEPEPKVDGAVVVMTKLKKSKIPKKRIMGYEEFLHKGFSKPRKMLNKVFSKKELADLGIDEKLRPQHIKVNKWVELFKESGISFLR